MYTLIHPPIHCQRLNIIGNHSMSQRIMGHFHQGLGIKSGIRRLFNPSPPARDPLGVPSRFAEGDWVRVRDHASVRETLDGRSRLRGLKFTPTQWITCSKIYRVFKSMRRIIDDKGVLRPISGTVLLAGVDCGIDGGSGGCGRHCPMMYRDEWLEPAKPGSGARTLTSGETRFARILSLARITRGLAWRGQREGLMFTPEMARFAGVRVRILRQLTRVFEYDRWLNPRHPIYILDLHCTGGTLGSDGPCDRACHLLWHADWLELED